MSENSKEQQALEAYLRLLAGKGAGPELLAQRQAVLQQLVPLLQNLSGNGNQYRDAVEALMQQADKSEWPSFLSAVREYYYFWSDDIKAIAAMHAGGDFDLAPAAAPMPDHGLQAMWASLDGAVFSVSEKWTLKAYASALRDEGAEKAVEETRVKLVKLLLLRLRDVQDKTPRAYRGAVNATLPLFALRETRMLFLIVVREFYYFWIGDPAAPGRIILDERPG